MVVGVTMRSALAASAIAAASANKKGKKRKRRALLTRCSGKGVDAVGGNAESCAGGVGGRRDWSVLPEPAVYLILMGLLPSVADAFSLGSVCKAWRSVFAACKRELFLALPPLLVDRGSSPRDLGGFYSLGERRFHRRKQPIAWPWLIYEGDVMDAVTRVIGVYHGYWIVRETCYSPYTLGPTPIFLMDPLSPEVRIHLPTAPHHVRHAFMSAPPSSPDCVIVFTDIDRILYCRPGDTELVSHRLMEGGGGGGCDDDDGDNDRFGNFWIFLEESRVAILGGKLYALAEDGKSVVIIELLFPRPRVTVVETKGLPRDLSGFLMESNGEILYVADEGEVKPPQLGPGVSLPIRWRRGHPCGEEHKCVVRRLHVPAREWVTLSTLGGDRCLFHNVRGTTLSCTAPGRWGVEPDCVYTLCTLSEMLLVLHMKDGRVEHRQMPEELPSYDWLIPSFCCPVEEPQ